MIDIDIALDLISILIIIAVITIAVTMEYKQKKSKEVRMKESNRLANEIIRTDKSFDYTRGHIQVFTHKGVKESKLDD
jgi:5-enolpyruvylshikimate-3-phosphate synthase